MYIFCDKQKTVVFKFKFYLKKNVENFFYKCNNFVQNSTLEICIICRYHYCELFLKFVPPCYKYEFEIESIETREGKKCASLRTSTVSHCFISLITYRRRQKEFSICTYLSTDLPIALKKQHDLVLLSAVMETRKSSLKKDQQKNSVKYSHSIRFSDLTQNRSVLYRFYKGLSYNTILNVTSILRLKCTNLLFIH